MLRPRIIPCLLIHKGGLVKTVQFGSPKYLGDPLNAVRIFNEKEVDELMVIDIDATREGRAPDETVIANLAAECRMPLAYGGGVKTVEQIERLIALGVEKVAVSSAAIEDPELIPRAVERVGRQSIVGVMDVKTGGLLRKTQIVTHNATKQTGLQPIEFAKRLQEMGVGEIVINSVDRDGMMQGYDMALVDSIRDVTDVPLTILGGAGKLDDIRELVHRHKVIGAAAGSLFVFKGKFRAVLINYPDRSTHEMLYRS
jgi:imidazole glycerol-phosphate synthase subunit HisF